MDAIHPADLTLLECEECGTQREKIVKTRYGRLLCETCYNEIYKIKAGDECPKCHLILADDFPECPRCLWPEIKNTETERR